MSVRELAWLLVCYVVLQTMERDPFFLSPIALG